MPWWRTTGGFDRLRFYFRSLFSHKTEYFILYEIFPISLKVLSFPRLTEKNRSEKQAVCFSILASFFRGPKNRATVFRTAFLRKAGKTVIFKDKNDGGLFFIFF